MRVCVRVIYIVWARGRRIEKADKKHHNSFPTPPLAYCTDLTTRTSEQNTRRGRVLSTATRMHTHTCVRPQLNYAATMHTLRTRAHSFNWAHYIVARTHEMSITINCIQTVQKIIVKTSNRIAPYTIRVFPWATACNNQLRTFFPTNDDTMRELMCEIINNERVRRKTRTTATAQVRRRPSSSGKTVRDSAKKGCAHVCVSSADEVNGVLHYSVILWHIECNLYSSFAGTDMVHRVRCPSGRCELARPHR